MLSNAHFDGAWQAAGDGPGAARPGCIVVFALLFGPLGGHPAPAILLMAAMSAACAVLLMHLVGRFATRRVALLAGLVWVLLPNHMSMEVWVTAAIILTSQLLVLVGLAGGLSDRRSTTGLVVVALVLGAAVLTYEASLPVIAVAVVVLPLILRGRLDLPLIGATALTTGLATLWILIHWFGGKALQPWADASQLIQTSFGWGLTPAALADTVGSVGALIGLTALAASAYRLASPRLEATDTDRLVLGGGAIMVLGFLPFLRYFDAPLGAGDRVNYITAMGAAIVWAALLAAASRQREIAGGVGLAILAGVCLLARGERIELWATAGRDAEAIATATVRQIPVPPEEGIVLGPTPVQRETWPRSSTSPTLMVPCASPTAVRM